MRIQSAFLANHATVTDGMLYALGGAASYLRRTSFPARVDLYLCCLVDVEDVLPTEPGVLSTTLTFTVRPIDQDLVLGTKEARMLLASDNSDAATHGRLIPVVADLREVILPTVGRYEVELELEANGEHENAVVGFEAVNVDAAQVRFEGDSRRPAP